MKPLPLLAALALAGCVGAQVATESATLEPTPAVSPAPVVVEGAAPGSIPPPRAFPTIYMKGGFVTTPEVHALVGEQVVWRNEDLYAHEIVSDAGFFTAQVIEAGGWWGHTFDAPNAYGYFCRIHPDVKGHVIVG